MIYGGAQKALNVQNHYVRSSQRYPEGFQSIFLFRWQQITQNDKNNIHGLYNFNLLQIMPEKIKENLSKRQYSRISLKKRKILVNMIVSDGYSIARAIKKLNIKLTTARLILQRYKETGTFPMRKFKKLGKMMLDLKETPKQIKTQQIEEVVKVEHEKQEQKISNTIKEEYSNLSQKVYQRAMTFPIIYYWPVLN